MPLEFVPILVLGVLAAGFAAIAIIVPSLLGPKRPTEAKLAPYEAGMLPITDPRRRFSIQYYVVAVLFILFDIEVIFLYPWAVLLKQLRWFGIVEMTVFLLVLLIGYLYVWRKGALDWD